MFMSPFFLLVNMQDIKFAPLKQNIWLSTRLLKVTIPLKAKENVVFEDDYHKVCWNVCLMSQQWPYSGQHPPRRSHSTYVWNDSWAQTLCISQFHLRQAPPTPPGLLRGICPPCQSRGWGISKFCAARGLDISQPPGQTRITTQRILLEKTSRSAHFSRRGKNWRGL